MVLFNLDEDPSSVNIHQPMANTFCFSKHSIIYIIQILGRPATPSIYLFLDVLKPLRCNSPGSSTQSLMKGQLPSIWWRTSTSFAWHGPLGVIWMRKVGVLFSNFCHPTTLPSFSTSRPCGVWWVRQEVGAEGASKTEPFRSGLSGTVSGVHTFRHLPKAELEPLRIPTSILNKVVGPLGRISWRRINARNIKRHRELPHDQFFFCSTEVLVPIRKDFFLPSSCLQLASHLLLLRVWTSTRSSCQPLTQHATPTWPAAYVGSQLLLFFIDQWSGQAILEHEPAGALHWWIWNCKIRSLATRKQNFLGSSLAEKFRWRCRTLWRAFPPTCRWFWTSTTPPEQAAFLAKSTESDTSWDTCSLTYDSYDLFRLVLGANCGETSKPVFLELVVLPNPIHID